MTIRILDEWGIELNKDDIDLSLGHLVPEQVFMKKHEPTEKTEEVYHYVVQTFYFEDGSKMSIDSEDDPHVKVIDDQLGRFEYVDQGEGKIFRGADIVKVIDTEAIMPNEGWDEYETINRYVPYTEEELAAQKNEIEQEKKKNDFLITGPDRLTNTELSLDDLILLMAEMIGA